MVLQVLRSPHVKCLHSSWRACITRKYFVTTTYKQGEQITVEGREYQTDHMTNVTPHLLSLVGRSLHMQKYHPLNHISQRIVHYMYQRYVSSRGNPLFSVHNNIHPVVTTHQNFDSLLIPKNHVSRQKSDNYYINEGHLLRAHTSAHQIFGNDENMDSLQLFEMGERTKEKQGFHHTQVLHLLEADLKCCLLGLATTLFGQDVEWRWVDAYFPFTHPSWELEVKLNNDWVELLGCGIIEQEILFNTGAEDKIGWAFGLGLERWAMKLYGIPDIRLFWSTDSGFLSQFHFDDPTTNVKYKTVSKFMQCSNDISFWLPVDGHYHSSDFFDLVRAVGGDIVEQVHLIDAFTHPKKRLTSHCYRIVYRHMEKVLTQEEVNVLHKRIEKEATVNLNVTIR
ncbi:phenylalanine--tRNA ligase, mitochondrial isoform X2 [Procambarus clarkii]|uniref:phenylalanine--tRNA ligase, mitochondrial isoform X2 n=1 Tax=Procambarus clarkii TaxID=6728 RepID=UPI001E670B91|nr:phenylalanine--tRNA ligase, mitochondrial-like isoform X2 [Procambarus clarkii]